MSQGKIDFTGLFIEEVIDVFSLAIHSYCPQPADDVWFGPSLVSQ